jgi:hypothetical protein
MLGLDLDAIALAAVKLYLRTLSSWPITIHTRELKVPLI